MPTALHAVRAQHSTRQSIRLGPFGHLQPHRDTTRVAGESILRVHVLPAFGQRPISSIETSEVQSWVTRLGQATYDANGAVVRAGLSPSTIEVVYGKVAAVFNAAIEDRLISRTPCGSRRVKMPRKDGWDILPMSPEQVAAMAAALPARLPRSGGADRRYRPSPRRGCGPHERPSEVASSTHPDRPSACHGFR